MLLGADAPHPFECGGKGIRAVVADLPSHRESTENAAVVMAQVGGPPDYIQENWDRLVGTAQKLAELRAAT